LVAAGSVQVFMHTVTVVEVSFFVRRFIMESGRDEPCEICLR
jgi:hypothetical protein